MKKRAFVAATTVAAVTIAAVSAAVTLREKEKPYCLIWANKKAPIPKKVKLDYGKVIDATVNDFGAPQEPTPEDIALFVWCYKKSYTTVLYASQELVDQLNELGVTPDIVYVV